MSDAVLVPVGQIRQRLDNDAADYAFSPDLYMTLALAYDSMAAPWVDTGADGVDTPDFTDMRPRLAESWSEQDNGDWIVKLRAGVRSPAGHEWTADDVAWAYRKAADQGVMASWRWFGVVGVTAIDVLDQHTVRYRLRAPYPTFPNWLLSVSPNMVDSAAISAHATDADPFGLDWLRGHVAGYGAYDLASMDGSRLVFEARDDHWGGAPAARRVEVTHVASRSEAFALLDEGRPVVLAGLDADETAEQLRLAGRDGRRVIRTWAGHASVEVDFTKPPFADLRVRHALAFATPYERVRQEGMRGFARPWNSPVKGVSQWYDATPLPYTLDLERARQLLMAAGHGGGLGTTLHVEAKPVAWRVAEILRESWAKVGIDVELRAESEVEPGRLPPLFLRTECGHNLSDPIYDLAHDYAAMNPLLPLPGGPAHVGGWHPRWAKNPPVIADYIDMLLEADRGAKRSKFDAFQRRLVRESTSIFLGEVQQTMVASERVPAGLTAPGSRFYQAMQLQNCTTNYLPGAA